MAISGAASKVAKKFQNSKINQKLTKKLDDVTSSLKSKTKNITANIAKKTKEATQKAVNTVSDKAKTIANKTLSETNTVKNAISNGIKNAPKGEKNKVASVIDSLGEGILSVRNVFAPSYEFAGVGAFKVTKNGFGESGEETLSQALGKDVQKLRTMFLSKNNSNTSKLNYNLIRKYIRDLESQTGYKLNHKQINELKNALRNKKYTKLSKEDTLKHRKKFNNVKNSLIIEWEKETKQKWPVYTNVIYDKKGNPVRNIGDYYDAHHIIENNYGGEHA